MGVTLSHVLTLRSQLRLTIETKIVIIINLSTNLRLSRYLGQKALYGMKTAARAFHEYFADTLRDMGFLPSRADQDLWYIKSSDHSGYDYISTHIDDFLIAAKNPGKYMEQIQQKNKSS